MQAAITDFTFPDLEIERSILSAAGCELISGQCKTTSALIEMVTAADVVITQFAPINAQVIESMQRAKAIVRYGIGYDNVDCEAARQKGIPVCNIPEFCIDEVADHTLAFILALTRHVRANCSLMLQGNWGLGVPLDKMRTLKNQTVGIIGLGRIGKATADRLQAFGPRLLAFDPVTSAADAAAHGCELVSLETLLRESDIVSLHCPSNSKTRGIINGDSIALMKRGSVLINVGRGDLVLLPALQAALESGQLSAAGLDVFEQEPIAPQHPILKMENVIVSSHIASASPTAVRTLRETAANLAVMALKDEPLPTIVNGV